VVGGDVEILVVDRAFQGRVIVEDERRAGMLEEADAEEAP
jgi:hypothetical protein